MKKKEVVDEFLIIIDDLKQKLLNQKESLEKEVHQNIDLTIKNGELKEKLEKSTVNNTLLIIISIIALIFLIFN